MNISDLSSSFSYFAAFASSELLPAMHEVPNFNHPHWTLNNKYRYLNSTIQVFPAPLKGCCRLGCRPTSLDFDIVHFLHLHQTSFWDLPWDDQKTSKKPRPDRQLDHLCLDFWIPTWNHQRINSNQFLKSFETKKNQETRKTPPIFGPFFLGPSLNKSVSMVSMAGCDGSSGCDLTHFGAAEVGGAAHRSPLQHPIGGPCLQMGLKTHRWRAKMLRKHGRTVQNQKFQFIEWSVFSKTTTRFFFGSTY